MKSKILWLCAVLALLAGCATKPDHPAAPESLPKSDQARFYIIGPGDSVSVVVWRNPELSGSYPVRPDGMITTPLVEDLPASGKTPTQLARDIEKALEKYVQTPIVQVIVTGFIGPYDQQVRIVGEAARPQTLPYREHMTVLDVMIAVGGITDFADGNKASILRRSGGKSELLSVRLKDLVRGGDVTANVPMQPGDILVIPQSFF